MLSTDALDYHLPPGRIATHPVEPRDAAKLLVLRRDDPGRFEHRTIADLPSLLDPGDRLICNTTRVLPARFRGFREETGGGVTGLYLHDDPTPGVWLAMVKARRHKPGSIIRLLTRETSDAPAAPSPYTLEMLEPVEDPPGAWRLRLRADTLPLPDAPTVLEAVGLTPLPPYILAARKAAHDAGDDGTDREQYQTVFAEPLSCAQPGSVAAPTAGLHFTPRLLEALAARGVARTGITLHVGAGTFKPVETETVEAHPIHAEWCSMSAQAIAEIRQTRQAGHRVVTVGTTSVRTIESYAPLADRGDFPAHLSTRLLLTPGCSFGWTDALLTNFHLPRSTLMALVAAMLQHPDEPPASDGTPVGVLRLKAAYAEAIARGYRFYSFGDAMLIL
ncbi:S-adenosylmethionine:tRNA ribosyltransferase-isomerase [hydrothermal vent metagenome]|uniref:S-adenosylmethionine:tRNA ribosyltransferase-isomerase n=1 Tax=hydrothermal vent metagenome TaxID=652676 RepID=A0A3B1DDP8_9ZZZZ